MVRPSLRCGRNLVTDGAAEFWILLANVSLVRVSEAHGNLMNRGRPVRFQRPFQDLLQPGCLANPDCSRLPPPMASAGLPMSGSDPVAEFSVSLVEPLGICVAQTSRHLRQAARCRLFKSHQKSLPDLARMTGWRYAPIAGEGKGFLCGDDVRLCRPRWSE